MIALALVLALAMFAVPAASSDGWNDATNLEYNDFVLSANGSEADPYTINMLTGDQYSYTITTNLPSTYSISSGNLSSIGFSFSTNKISGTAGEGKELVCITATSTEGPVQVKEQWVQFNVYNVLSLSGTITQNAWANTAYSSAITVTDVDPDASNETTLTLNAEATTAGYTITKVNETSWTLERAANNAVAGSVEVSVTATTNAGGIDQSKTMISTVTTYDQVGFTSTPSGHSGQGTTVWLIEGTGSWTYTPTATPAGTTITVSSGLDSNITYANGVLSVKKVVFDSKEITLTATSTSGGSTKTATQTLNIRVWDELEFLTSPSVSDITHTVDGRTYTFSVQAANYRSLTWDINGQPIDNNNSDTLTYNFDDAAPGTYTVRATAMDAIGRTDTSTTTILLENNEGDNPTPVDPDTNDKTDYAQWIKDNAIALIILAIGAVILIVGIKEEETWVAVIGAILVIVSLALVYCAYADIDLVTAVKDWFNGLKGGDSNAA